MEIPSTIKSILHKFDATIIEVNRMNDQELIRSAALWTKISKEKKMKFWSGKFNLVQTVEALLIAQGLEDEQVSNVTDILIHTGLEEVEAVMFSNTKRRNDKDPTLQLFTKAVGLKPTEDELPD